MMKNDIMIQMVVEKKYKDKVAHLELKRMQKEELICSFVFPGQPVSLWGSYSTPRHAPWIKGDFRFKNSKLVKDGEKNNHDSEGS